MRPAEDAVRARWAALVEKGRPCPHGLPYGECLPCARMAAHPNNGRPISPWCPAGHLKDKWDAKYGQLYCSECRREATRRWRERQRQEFTGQGTAGVE